jgi:ribosomal protein S19
MSRSKYKLTFVHRSQINKFLTNKIKRTNRQNLYKHMVNKFISVSPLYFFWKRYSNISKKLLNKKICVYNGKVFHIVNTNLKFRGFKLGEFAVSRKKPIHKGKQKQIKKIIRKIIRKRRN